MERQVDKAILVSGKNVEIELIYNLEEMLQYRTWIIPTLIINDKIISRGFTPDINSILKFLK